MKTRLVLLLCAALLVAACGSRVDDAGRAETEGGGGDNPPAAQGSDGDSDSDGGEGADPSTESDGPDEGETSSAGMIGSLPIPCGNTADGELAAPAEADGTATVGVTADTISLATIADPGNVAVPGLNQEMFDAMSAFESWCNELGGINGRMIDVTLLDAALFEYATKAEEACNFAFANVGTGAVFDDTGAQTLVDCGMVSVPGFTLNSQFSLSDRMVQPNPNPPDTYLGSTVRYMAETFPEETKKAGALTADLPTTITQRDRTVQGGEGVGWEFVEVGLHQPGEQNWGPIIKNLQDQDVQIVTHVGTPEETVNLLAAMDTQNYEPLVMIGPNNYDANFLELAGDLADDVYIEGTYLLTEEAEPGSATEAVGTILSDNGFEPSLLGYQAFASALLFATAADAVGADLTREALLAELKTINEWDSGGLHGVQNPAENVRSDCGLTIQVLDGAFTRAHPEEGFDCTEGNAVPIDVPFMPGATEG